MTDTTTIRIDRRTHRELQRLAGERRSTVSDTVAQAVRALRQDKIGRQLRAPPERSEADWLDADLG